jgi:hypothetical protein
MPVPELIEIIEIQLWSATDSLHASSNYTSHDQIKFADRKAHQKDLNAEAAKSVAMFKKNYKELGI